RRRAAAYNSTRNPLDLLEARKVGPPVHRVEPPIKECLMARVTVEDCIDKVDNRFELVLLASHRARMVSSGAQITIERDNDKNPVVALREIAEKTISPG